jgi:hypothetical protein
LLRYGVSIPRVDPNLVNISDAGRLLTHTSGLSSMYVIIEFMELLISFS